MLRFSEQIDDYIEYFFDAWEVCSADFSDSLCLQKKVTSRTPSGTQFRRIVSKQKPPSGGCSVRLSLVGGEGACKWQH